MPEIRNIIESITANRLILDEEIRSGVFAKDNMGKFVHYVGGFTVVFPVTVKNEKWAFRCWHNDIGIDNKRLDVLSKNITSNKLKYFCDFKYNEKGITVNGKIYPTSKMHWVEGKNINEYILDHKNERNVLTKLADDFLDMTRELHKIKIAHGDLQQGNIMVNEKGEIFLVDYDSLYCPEMGDVEDIIKGKPEFQHPARKSNVKATSCLDYFAELIIYISVLAIAQRPELVDKYDIEDSLLFKASDFENIEKSSIYKDISALGGIFILLLKLLKEDLLKNDINELIPLDDYLKENDKIPEILKFECEEGNKILKGKSITIDFEVLHATEMTLNNDKIDVGTKNLTKKTEKSGIFSYVLQVTNWKGSISKKIQIEVMELPAFDIELSRPKIRKGSEECCVIKWNIENLSSIKLIKESDGEIGELEATGTKTLSPPKSTKYIIRGIALDDKTTAQEDFEIKVLEESQIEFKSDKRFAYDSIPITLYWKTKYAKKVELNGELVEMTGQKRILEGIDQDTTFELKVEDDFGTKRQKIQVRLLPLPIIKTVIVPAPDARITMNVNVSIPTPISMVDLIDKSSQISELTKVQLKEINIRELDPIIEPKFEMPEPIRWWKFSKVYQYFKEKIQK